MLHAFLQRQFPLFQPLNVKVTLFQFTSLFSIFYFVLMKYVLSLAQKSATHRSVVGKCFFFVEGSLAIYNKIVLTIDEIIIAFLKFLPFVMPFIECYYKSIDKLLDSRTKLLMELIDIIYSDKGRTLGKTKGILLPHCMKKN